jgi:hypothetical protein
MYYAQCRNTLVRTYVSVSRRHIFPPLGDFRHSTATHQAGVFQQIFLDFVLYHYVSVGVEELDQEKLTPLLRIRYHDSIADAVADLGKPEEIGKLFSGFQKYLYQQQAIA